MKRINIIGIENIEICNLSKPVTVGICLINLQVYNTSASLFLNGQEEDGTALDTQTLARPVDDITSAGTVWIGTSSNGNDFSPTVYCPI